MLETVLLQDLETVDVQEPQALQLGGRGGLVVGNAVYLVYYPLEQTLVEDLGQRVYQLLDLAAVEVLCQGLTADPNGVAGQGVGQRCLLHSE